MVFLFLGHFFARAAQRELMDKEEKIFLRQIQGKVGSSLHKFDMLQNGDHILIAVSGGVDSLSLLSIMADRMRFRDSDFKLTAVYVDIENMSYHADTEWMQNWCSERGIHFIHDRITVDFSSHPKPSVCFYCSWNRRKRLFKICREQGGNKLAMGHHMDDAVETMMLNIWMHGTISALPGKLEMFDGDMYLLRPLIEILKEDIIRYAQIVGLPQIEKNCPYDADTQRRKVHNTLNGIENQFPGARKKAFKALGEIYRNYLPVPPDCKVMKYGSQKRNQVNK